MSSKDGQFLRSIGIAPAAVVEDEVLSRRDLLEQIERLRTSNDGLTMANRRMTEVSVLATQEKNRLAKLVARYERRIRLLSWITLFAIGGLAGIVMASVLEAF